MAGGVSARLEKIVKEQAAEIERLRAELAKKPCPRCGGSGRVRDDAETGWAMKGRREQAGLVLREVAAVMNLSVGYVSDLEHGRKPWSEDRIKEYTRAMREAKRRKGA